jgi:hypothetical protein
VATSAGAQELAMRESADFRWVCGGVGAEERAALAALRPQANLELLFVTAKRGGYLADAEVSLLPKGTPPRPALHLDADGPMCLIDAPAGRYRIEASFEGRQRVAEVSLPGKAGAPAKLVFSFPAEPWDGIWASEEEKQQAK